MAPKTRSQDVRRMEDSLEAANQRVNEMEAKLHAQSDDLAQLKAMMKEIATQQIAIQQTLQTLSGEANSSQNREMKIWASASEEGWLLPNGSDSLNCTQTLELKNSAEPGAEEAFFNQVVALSQMGLILLANAKKNAIYVVHLDYGPNLASTRLDYISEFTVTMLILSLSGTSDVMHDQSVAQVYCVQTQAIQLVLKMTMLPKPIFWFYRRKKIPLTEATWEEAEEFSWWLPSFHLEDKVDVMERALSRTKEKKKVKGNERKAEA